MADGCFTAQERIEEWPDVSKSDSFSTGGRAERNFVSCLSMAGVTLSRISSKSSGGILR